MTNHVYKNPSISAVVFDWAGTIIDFGSHAPMQAFVRLFGEYGIELSIEDARGPMGLPKWKHIHALGNLPHINQQWQQKFNRPFTDKDTDELYAIFTPMNAASVMDHSQLIPGFLSTLEILRTQGIKVGTTTGYNREIMNVVLPLVKEQGFTPDNLVCADDLPESRPSPLGMYQCFLDLNVWPATSVIKVDDTVPGLLEGYNSGCWTVGVIASGNEVGLTHEEWHSLNEDEKNLIRTQVSEKLSKGKPNFLIDTVADLPKILKEIDTLRLKSHYESAE
ncbi:phosphonoacetaldehyde hydrolase [Zwartia panacis]|uniref:phosphonoacetaldehyde hydrolase n=1 Tax=Zwartia panacis TaxID=2683345 RepID=UPI0025B5BEB4|nr:phosphonoacetaldehyde hydrolase [Zwartia panacis]MDN4017778.1 phosphonoacetaldehyde hydrolase [Zwartia panacis]